MLAIHVLGPDGLADEDHGDAIDALTEVGYFTKTQAKALLSALLDMKILLFEIPDGTEDKLQILRDAGLLVQLVGNPDPDEELTNEAVWEAWAEA